METKKQQNSMCKGLAVRRARRPQRRTRRNRGHCNRRQAGTQGSFRGVPGLDGGGKLAVTGEAGGRGWDGAGLTPSHPMSKEAFTESDKEMWESPLLSLTVHTGSDSVDGPQGCQAVGGTAFLLPPLFISSPIPSALPLRRSGTLHDEAASFGKLPAH